MSHVNTVCLCGSTRFAHLFQEANVELSKRGFSVITISMAAEKDESGNEKEPALKEVLDLVHLNKILRSDAVFVVGDGYVGFSTAREIIWADMQGKPVIWQSYVGRDYDDLVRRLRQGFHSPGVFDKARAVLRKQAGK